MILKKGETVNAITTETEGIGSANDLDDSRVAASTVDVVCRSEEDLLFDAIASSALEDTFSQPTVGPNCLVLYQFVLTEQFSVGPYGEIYSSDI